MSTVSDFIHNVTVFNEQRLNDSLYDVGRAYVHAFRPHLASYFFGYVPEDYNPNEAGMCTLADMHESARDTPTKEDVITTYDALIEELALQFMALVSAGYTFHAWTKEGQPYANSASMCEDVNTNKRLDYFPTVAGFGDNDSTASVTDSANPLAVESLFTDSDGWPMLWNDVLRCVHDVFGHALHGNTFSATGELRAFVAHACMFSASARPALACETLLQNAWVNYGAHLRDASGHIPTKGEPGYISPASRPYAPQKTFNLGGMFYAHPMSLLSAYKALT